FMGDSMFYAVLRDLAAGDYPLLAGSRRNLSNLADAELCASELWLTALGKRVLAGKADWFELGQPARWMGGVLVRGPKPRWRWDRKRGRVVEQRGKRHGAGKPKRKGKRVSRGRARAPRPPRSHRGARRARSAGRASRARPGRAR